MIDPTGELRKRFKGGKNRWVSVGEFAKLPDRFKDLDLLEKMVNSSEIEFVENKIVEDKY